MSRRWEVDKLYDDTGAVAIITATEKESKRGVFVNYSVGFFREFERAPDAPVERSSFIRDYQLDSLPVLAARAKERIEVEKAKHLAEQRAKRNHRMVSVRDAISRSQKG